VLLDQKRVLPCTAYLEGEYGIENLYIGVPVKLGAGGIEEVFELDISEQERTWLEESAAAVREVVAVLGGS
jgi:malate dehydrogenase